MDKGQLLHLIYTIRSELTNKNLDKKEIEKLQKQLKETEKALSDIS